MIHPDEVGPGDRLADRYRLEEVIARGGVSSVYRATDDRGAVVAVKVLRSEMLENEEIASRFRRGAEAASALRSPHTAQVLDFGHIPGGGAFMVMEFLQGNSLDQELLERGALPLPQVIAIVRAMLASLREAHAHDIIHRDLKPSNTFLCRGASQCIKVLDFGFLLDLSRKARLRITTSGAILGTPMYMAPEQFNRERLTPATDIYALGLILYEMLVGHSPFEDMSDAEMYLAKDEGIPIGRGLSLDPTLAGFGAMVMRATRRLPADRYVSCTEMLSELDGLTTSLVSQPVAGPMAADPDLLEVDWYLELAAEAERREQRDPAARSYYEALKVLRGLMETNSGDLDVRRQFIYTATRLANSEGDMHRAERVLSDAIALLGDAGELWLARGDLRLGNNALEGAATDFAAVLELTEHPAHRVDAWLGLARSARLIGDFKDALFFAEAAREACDTLASRELACRSHIELSNCHVALAQVEPARIAVNKALSLAEALDDPGLLVEAYVASSSYNMLIDHHVAAEGDLKAALRVSDTDGLRARQGELLLLLGETVEAQGRAETAELHLALASESYLLTGDTGALAELLRAKFRRRRSALDLVGARRAAVQAAEGFREGGRRGDEAGVLLELGAFEVVHGSPTEASSTLQASLRAQQDTGPADLYVDTLLLLATTSGALGRTGLATSYLKTALAWAVRQSSLGQQNIDRLKIAIGHLRLGQIVAADEVLRPAMATSSHARGLRVWLDYAAGRIQLSDLKETPGFAGHALDPEIRVRLEALIASSPPALAGAKELREAMILVWPAPEGDGPD